MTPDERDLVAALRGEVAEELHREVEKAVEVGRSMDLADQRVFARGLINRRLAAQAATALSAGASPRPEELEQEIAQAVEDLLFGLGVLSRLLADDRVENIDANSASDVWVTYADGHVERGPVLADSDGDLVELIRAAGRRMGLSERRFDPSHPFLTMQLPDGSRLFAVQAVTGRPAICVRRHRYNKVHLGDLIGLGMLDDVAAEFLAAAVRARLNIIVSGGTNAGKTTLLRALVNEIPATERLVTIEKDFELGVHRHPELHPNVVAMEARDANVEGEGAIPMRDLVRQALRMNPSRVIVGEVLGDELLPMLNAMTQGRDGSLCSIHAHSSEGTFNRFTQYAVQAPERLDPVACAVLVANAVDLVVFVDQEDPAGGTGRQRFIGSIREVVGADGQLIASNEVFAPAPDGRAMPSVAPTTRRMNRLVRAGLDRELFAAHLVAGRSR